MSAYFSLKSTQERNEKSFKRLQLLPIITLIIETIKVYEQNMGIVRELGDFFYYLKINAQFFYFLFGLFEANR